MEERKKRFAYEYMRYKDIDSLRMKKRRDDRWIRDDNWNDLFDNNGIVEEKNSAIQKKFH